MRVCATRLNQVQARHAISATPANDRGCKIAPSATPATQTVECHACHVKSRRQAEVGRRHASRAPKPRPSAPPKAMRHHNSAPPTWCATPATQNDGTCESVPRLPRKTTVDATPKDDACHACQKRCHVMVDVTTPATQKWSGAKGVTPA